MNQQIKIKMLVMLLEIDVIGIKMILQIQLSVLLIHVPPIKLRMERVLVFSIGIRKHNKSV